jgi:hypothetical protein
MNTKAIEKATGKSWEEWLNFFENMPARGLSHKEIAKKAFEQGGVSPWWAQMITVAYEQHIGRRRPGQRFDGKYQVTSSKSVNGTLDQTLHSWLRLVGGRREFSGVPIARAPTASRSGKYRYWHCGLSDGSRLNMSIYQKEPGKAVIGLGHENLKSFKQIAPWRAYWKAQLAMVSPPSKESAPGPKKHSARPSRVAQKARPRRRR